MFRGTKKQLNNDLKYNGIINAFRNMGYHAWCTYNDNGAIFIDDGKEKKQIGRMNLRFEKITRNIALYRAVKKLIKKRSIIFKYCYIRMMPVLPGYMAMVKAMKKAGAGVALEIPTYPHVKENKTDTPLRKILLEYMEKRNEKAAKYTDLYMPMGEHADYIYGKPAINIQNGVDVKLIKERQFEKKNDDSVYMLAVAKMTRWHGYDRVIEGMKEYYKNAAETKVYFYLVGPEGDGTLSSYRKMVSDYGLENYVLFEGPKFGDDSNEYFNKSDTAFATLGTHRKNISSISSLKVGEYMARGIPFVYESSECQVRKDWEFAMSVESNDSPVNIQSIVEFAAKMRNIDGLNGKMRNIAEKDFSWEEQLQRMINYFEKKRESND